MEPKKLKLDLDAENLGKILNVLSSSKFYTKPFADELGRSVAEFYKEMLQDNLPVELATEYTRDYLSFINYPTNIENLKLNLELEYSKKLAEVYKEVNDKLWNLLNNLNLSHTIDAKAVIGTKVEKTE